MKFRLLFLFLFVGMIMGNAQHLSMKNYQRKMLPVSMVPISDSVYSDRAPITNLDWREYLYWLEKVYGEGSNEYRAALPDEQVLKQQLPDSIAIHYLHQPVYNSFPVLGISLQQARHYCQWRTDRVAEVMLVRMKLLTYNPNQSPNDHFTLENQEIPKDLKILHFYLPNENMETRYGFGCFAMWR